MSAIFKKDMEEQLLDDITQVGLKRDKVAFSRLFDHYVPLIRAFTLSAHPGANLLANEISQEVMLKVWRKAHTFRPEAASLNTWIYTLARNSRIDYLRKHGRHQSNIDSEAVYHNLTDDDAPGPFQAAQQQKEKERIHALLESLPPEQRTVLVKIYMEGKKHSEIAKELEMPLGTVKSRVRLALKKLASSYTQ